VYEKYLVIIENKNGNRNILPFIKLNIF